MACSLAHFVGHEPDIRHSRFFNVLEKEYHCPNPATALYCFQEFGPVGVGVGGEVEVAETRLNGFTRGNLHTLGETDA